MPNRNRNNEDLFTSMLSNPGNDSLIPMTFDSSMKGSKKIDLTKDRATPRSIGERAGKGVRKGAGFVGKNLVDLANPAGPLNTRVRQMTGISSLGQALGGFGEGLFNLGGKSDPPQGGANMGIGSDGIPNSLRQTQRSDMGVGEDGIPNSLRRREQSTQSDPVVEALGGYERGAEFDNTNVGGESMTQPQDMASDFAGRMIENMTPRGVPEPEEISGLGKALSTFGKALSTPGFQRFLSEMGIAFSGGREGSAGTMLGQANIQKLDADAEAEVMQRLLAGESLEDIDMSMMRNVDSVRATTDVAMGQQQMRMQEGAQEFDQESMLRRLEQYDEQLGIQRDRLDIDWLRALGEQNQASKPDSVNSTEHGYALSTIASADLFHKAALKSLEDRAEELNLSSIREIQMVLQGDDGQLDPMAVRANIPRELQREFDRHVNQLSQSISRSYRDVDNPGDLDYDYDSSIYRPSSRQEAESAEDGTIMQLPNGQYAIKVPGGFRPFTKGN